MADRRDSWESTEWGGDWESGADTPEEIATERRRLHELARTLLDQRERQRAADLAQLEELKSSLRQRAADIVKREGEVAARWLELDRREQERPSRLRLPQRKPPEERALDERVRDVERRERELDEARARLDADVAARVAAGLAEAVGAREAELEEQA